MTIRIYERVSSRDQRFDAQHGDLQRWADYKAGAGESVVWYQDKFTGRKMDRPGFTKLLSEVQAGDMVAVWRLDRLGRTTVGLVNLFDRWQKAGVGFYSLRDSFDLDTPTGRLMLNIMISIAAYETEVRAERVAAGRKGKPRGPSKLKGVRQKVTPEQKVVICAEFKTYGNVSRCAKATGLTRPTVYSVLREAGLTTAMG